MNRAQAIYLSTEEVYRVTWRINGTSDIHPLTSIFSQSSVLESLGEMIKEEAGREVEIILCPWFEHFWLAFVWVAKGSNLNENSCVMRRHCCHPTHPKSAHQPHLPLPTPRRGNTVLCSSSFVCFLEVGVLLFRNPRRWKMEPVSLPHVVLFPYFQVLYRGLGAFLSDRADESSQVPEFSL